MPSGPSKGYRYPPDPVVQDRVKKMLLLEFTAAEMLPTLEASLSRPITLGEVAEQIARVRETWQDNPDEQELLLDMNTAWSRSTMFRRDLLGVYQDTLRNFNASQSGEFTHPDGQPVLATKGADVLMLAEKIQKMEGDWIASRQKVLAVRGAHGTAPPVVLALSLHDDDEDDLDQPDVPVTSLV